MRTSPYTKIDTQNDNEPDTVKSISVERYERCAFCNSKLVFSHDLNLSYLQVVETSQCPGCGVSTHPRKFTLH